jgi:hypothetical protein
VPGIQLWSHREKLNSPDLWSKALEYAVPYHAVPLFWYHRYRRTLTWRFSFLSA